MAITLLCYVNSMQVTINWFLLTLSNLRINTPEGEGAIPT
jgi:hypothetical protein